MTSQSTARAKTRAAASSKPNQKLTPDPAWRQIPASLIEEYFALANGNAWPPTFDELAELLVRRRFQVIIQEKSVCPEAFALLSRRLIVIPRARPRKMLYDLLHEAAEIYTRLPIAPEFNYEETGRNEHHEVANVTVQRLRGALEAEYNRLFDEEIAVEAELETAQEEVKQRVQELEAFTTAIKEGRDFNELRMPDQKAMKIALQSLTQKRAKLKDIQARIRSW